MKNRYRIQVLLLACFMSLFWDTVSASNAKAEWCEKQWKSVSADFPVHSQPNYTELLAKWKGYGTDCSGTVAYEARLSTIYSLLKNLDKAREVLLTVKTTHSDYKHLSDLASLQIETAELANDGISMEDVSILERKYLGLVKQYPEFYDAYGFLGTMQTILGKYDEAIISLNFATKSSMELSSVYRNLTISYTETGNYNEAIRAANEAISRNKNLTSDPYYAYAFAKASAGVGDFKTAETVIKVIAAKVPEVRSEPEFKEAVDFVLEKKAAKAK